MHFSLTFSCSSSPCSPSLCFFSLSLSLSVFHFNPNLTLSHPSSLYASPSCSLVLPRAHEFSLKRTLHELNLLDSQMPHYNIHFIFSLSLLSLSLTILSPSLSVSLSLFSSNDFFSPSLTHCSLSTSISLSDSLSL